MKKIFFILMLLTFSISVSAHQSTKTFQKEIAAKTFTMESSQMYTVGNGGILQLIYNVFYKVGNMIATTTNTIEIPKDEETTTED